MCAPSFANSTAVARPMPVSAPVMRTTAGISASVFILSWLSLKLLSGIHSAVHSKVRPGDVRRFRSGDECHHRGDIVNVAIAVECCGGLLRHRPLAGGGI